MVQAAERTAYINRLETKQHLAEEEQHQQLKSPLKVSHIQCLIMKLASVTVVRIL